MKAILRAAQKDLIKSLTFLTILLYVSDSMSQTEKTDDCISFIANAFNIQSEFQEKFNIKSKRNKKFNGLCVSYRDNEFCVESSRSIKTIKHFEDVKFYDSLFLHKWIDVSFFLDDIGIGRNDSIDMNLDRIYLKTVDDIKNERNNLHATYIYWKKNILNIYIEQSSKSVKKIKVTNSKIIENEKHAKEIIQGLFNHLNSCELWDFQNIGMFFSILKKSEYNN